MDKKRKNSYILIAALLLFSAAVFCFAAMNRGRAAIVIVTSDGNEIIRESLDDFPKNLEVKSQYGTNILEIVELKDGKKGIRCVNADCPEHVCIETGIISEENETIVCLPHRLTVRLVK